MVPRVTNAPWSAAVRVSQRCDPIKRYGGISPKDSLETFFADIIRRDATAEAIVYYYYTSSVSSLSAQFKILRMG
jgi:hypothetical protein